MSTKPIDIPLDSSLQLLNGGVTQNPGGLMSILRDGGKVTRWHAERLQGQSVAEHSHGVAVILCFIADNVSAHLLKAALFHDLSEKTVGDMPAPIKWDNPHIAQFLDEESDRVERALGIHVILTPQDKRLLKLADYLDASYYALEQRMMGNKNADGIFTRLTRFFENRVNLFEYPKAAVMWGWLKDKYKEAQA